MRRLILVCNNECQVHLRNLLLKLHSEMLPHQFFAFPAFKHHFRSLITTSKLFEQTCPNFSSRSNACTIFCMSLCSREKKKSRNDTAALKVNHTKKPTIEFQGGHWSGKIQGNLIFLQGQGKVGEFCKLVREILDTKKVRESQGIS